MRHLPIVDVAVGHNLRAVRYVTCNITVCILQYLYYSIYITLCIENSGKKYYGCSTTHSLLCPLAVSLIRLLMNLLKVSHEPFQSQFHSTSTSNFNSLPITISIPLPITIPMPSLYHPNVNPRANPNHANFSLQNFHCKSFTTNSSKLPWKFPPPSQAGSPILVSVLQLFIMASSNHRLIRSGCAVRAEMFNLRYRAT